MSDTTEFENPDNLKLHKDIAWVMRSIWGLVIVGFVAGVWATSLASDVASNTKAAEDNAAVLAERKAAIEAAKNNTATLGRIEELLKEQDTRQRDMQDSIARVETKVEALEKKVDEQD